MRGVKRFAGVLASAALFAAPGCGGGNPSVSSSSAEAKVTGTVKVNGKAVTSGQVKFNPANVNRKNAPVRTAEIKPDGSFEVTTLVGENTATVTGPEVAAEPKAMMNQKVVDVKDGGPPVPIELP